MSERDKQPIPFREFKIWRKPEILDADIEDLPAIADKPREPEVDACEEIHLTLLEHGVSPTLEAVRAIEQWHTSRLDRYAMKLGGEAFRRMLLCLPVTPSTLALRALVFGIEESSLRQMAKEDGCSQPALSKQLKCLRKRWSGSGLFTLKNE